MADTESAWLLFVVTMGKKKQVSKGSDTRERHGGGGQAKSKCKK